MKFEFKIKKYDLREANGSCKKQDAVNYGDCILQFYLEKRSRVHKERLKLESVPDILPDEISTGKEADEKIGCDCCRNRYPSGCTACRISYFRP